MVNQDLIDKVLSQIVYDIQCHDLTAIEELLWKADEEDLINYLPEEEALILYGDTTSDIHSLIKEK